MFSNKLNLKVKRCKNVIRECFELKCYIKFMFSNIVQHLYKRLCQCRSNIVFLGTPLSKTLHLLYVSQKYRSWLHGIIVLYLTCDKLRGYYDEQPTECMYVKNIQSSAMRW